MTTEFPLQRKITKKKCPFSLTCVVFVDLLETLVTKVTIGCKRHGTDIAFSKILESKRVPLFYVVGSAKKIFTFVSSKKCSGGGGESLVVCKYCERGN